MCVCVFVCLYVCMYVYIFIYVMRHSFCVSLVND